MRIAKEFSWEMGHRLPGHPVCQNVHGHSYRMVVELEGEPDRSGMLLDYGVVSDLVRPILAELDHSFMVDPDDELMGGFLTSSGLKATRVGFRSTAENIAKWILEKLSPRFFETPGVQSVTVRVHETTRTAAEATARR
ncbi:MAG: 6-pyruvoyl tetrahydropterin synthase family protein [Fimbriimonadaceae bacterium]|nr:6-pyruvoyl tetrahydropterin synthase family protein [Fimbriimonadaceae bacterium]QYK54864.1 MAG: 6-pyruvoyl tetrahydropterin synthase family protein [Fimbriimonadaceae bacterium]